MSLMIAVPSTVVGVLVVHNYAVKQLKLMVGFLREVRHVACMRMHVHACSSC